MMSVNARRVSPRRCIRPRTADFAAWGAESARYICEMFISFLVVISFLLKFDFFFLTYRFWQPATTLVRLYKFTIAHFGSSVPARSAAMYAAYQSGQFPSCPLRFSCSPWAAAARRIALARSFADAKVVVAGSTRPGKRRVTSWTIHTLPSGSSKETYEP